MISVVVLTYNESTNIAECLTSVEQISDDVLVVDSHSTDTTRELARAKGARVVTRPFRSFADQRNFAMEAGELRHDWVFHLDADERITSDLGEELLEISKSAPSKSVYRVASKLMFRDRWLRYSGMYPSYQVRYGRASRLRFLDHGHGQREDPLRVGEVGTLEHPLLHYGFSKGLTDWIERHNRYSTEEARQALTATPDLHFAHLLSPDPVLRRRALKAIQHRSPARPAVRFFYCYLFRRGFLDGLPGLEYSALMAIYEYFISAKIDELCD